MFRRKNQRGSQAIEFALTIPVLMALTAGLVDYGWFFGQQHQVDNAVRDAARGAVVLPLYKNPEAVAEARVKALLASSDLDVAVDAKVVGVAPQMRLVVRAKAPYQPLFGMVPAPETVGATIEMFLEKQPEPLPEPEI